MLIYNRLKYYQSILPLTLTAFRAHYNVTKWCIGEPDKTWYVSKYDTYTAADSVGASNKLQAILNVYFPSGAPASLAAASLESAAVADPAPVTTAEVEVLAKPKTVAWTNSLTRLPNGRVQFKADGAVVDTYRLMTSTNLADWTQVDSGVVPTMSVEITDEVDPRVPQRFYKLEKE